MQPTLPQEPGHGPPIDLAAAIGELRQSHHDWAGGVARRRQYERHKERMALARAQAGAVGSLVEYQLDQIRTSVDRTEARLAALVAGEKRTVQAPQRPLTTNVPPTKPSGSLIPEIDRAFR